MAPAAMTGIATPRTSRRTTQGTISPTGRRPLSNRSSAVTSVWAPTNATPEATPNVAPSSTSLNRLYCSSASGPATISSTLTMGATTPRTQGNVSPLPAPVTDPPTTLAADVGTSASRV